MATRMKMQWVEEKVEQFARAIGTEYGNKPGNVTLEENMGGLLVQGISDTGGHRDILGSGRYSKQGLFDQMVTALYAIMEYKRSPKFAEDAIAYVRKLESMPNNELTERQKELLRR